MFAAFLGAIVWLIRAPDFEPAITSIALLASLVAIYSDRVIADRERKKELLIALIHELYMNVGVFEDIKTIETNKEKRRSIYPRIYTASLKTTTSSGFLTGTKDKKLWRLLTTWLQYSEDFNNRIAVHENRIFSQLALETDFEIKIMESEIAKRTINAFESLFKCLLTEYSDLTKINESTELFKA